MKDNLWSIVSGTEEAPGEENTNTQRKFMARRDCTIMIIVLAIYINPSLLYPLGDPEDLKAVWK